MYKKIVNVFLKDYTMQSAKKIMKLRMRILITKSKVLKLLYIRKYRKLLFKNNSFLPTTNEISNDLTFPHGIVGIFVSNNARIGDNCVIFQHVTIGSNTLNDSKNKGFPIIGNNCYIGAGAKIIGNVKVGNNVRIGANAVVVENIPDNSTVVGVKSRVIQKNKTMNNSFLGSKEFLNTVNNVNEDV